MSHRARNGGRDTLSHWSESARAFLLGPDYVGLRFSRERVRQERLRSRTKDTQRYRAALIESGMEE
jgi:hypothetical protein